MGELRWTNCSMISWDDTERRRRFRAGDPDSLLMDSLSELRRMGERMVGRSKEVKSCELVIAMRRSLQGDEVACRAGGLVLEDGR